MRFIGLDLIRCLAIALLLLAHIGQIIKGPIGNAFGLRHFYYVSLGGLAVTIFLILSGIVLELQYGKKKTSYSQFIIKRLIRIYPVYYLCLLFGLLIYSIRSYYETGHIFANFSKLGIVDIALSVTGGYAFVGRWGGPFIATSWFIALIITMYIFFPLLSREINKRPLFSICVLLLVSFFSRIIIGHCGFLHRPLDWFPLCRIFEFSLGIYLAIILPKTLFKLLKPSRRLGSSISFISRVSFPLFLIHCPLLLMINYLMMLGVNQLLSICLYVLLSVTISWIIFAIDKKIPKAIILKRIIDIFKRKRYGLNCG